MLYLTSREINQIGIDWSKTIQIIENAVHLLNKNDYDQPIKPYLTFDNPSNRIIAMPARGGGDLSMAGIKWISSFPNNIEQGLKRAHSITVLNDDQTGIPFSIINSSLVSGIRTASVSGLILSKYMENRENQNLIIGILGFGPIGQLHLEMVEELLNNQVSKVILYDIRGVNKTLVPESINGKVEIVQTWVEAYENSDIFITCTTSSKGYISKKPKQGSLLLNVSLREFSSDILDYTQTHIVDNWDEVCRANTDIEIFHQERNFQKEDTFSIVDVVCNQDISAYPENKSIMFHPMGMALFDLAISKYYYDQALENNIGVMLSD